MFLRKKEQPLPGRIQYGQKRKAVSFIMASRHTKILRDKVVLSIDSGSFDRMRYGFPEDKVYEITDAEREKELCRCEAILHNIEEKNSLPHLPVGEMNTNFNWGSPAQAVGDFSRQGKETYTIEINPLITKSLTDDSLAHIFGHELAHI